MKNYFSHDSAARDDERILALRMKHGWEGYGLFWALIEKLREEKDYTLLADYNIIAYDLRVSSSIIKSVIIDFGLFTFSDNGERFYSESLLRRMEMKDAKSIKARASATARWSGSKSDRNANALRTHCDRNAKKRKVKESKVNNISLSTRETKFISDLLIEPMNCLLEDQAWLEPVCMNNHISLIEAKDYIILFFADLQNREDYSKTAREAKDHFAKWLRIQLQEKERQKKGGYDERNNYHRADAEPAAKTPKDYSGGF